MAHTEDAVIVNAAGEVQMIVIPDDNSQLGDPAYNPAGLTHLRIPHDDTRSYVEAAAALYPERNVHLR